MPALYTVYRAGTLSPPPIMVVPDLFLLTGRKEGKRQQVRGPLGFQELQDPPCGWQDQVWGRTPGWETTKG